MAFQKNRPRPESPGQLWHTYTCMHNTGSDTDPHQSGVWIQNLLPSLNILPGRTANYNAHVLIWIGLKYNMLSVQNKKSEEMEYPWKWSLEEGFISVITHLLLWDQSGTPSSFSQFSGAFDLAKNMMLLTLRFFWLAFLWPVTLLTDSQFPSRRRQKNLYLQENTWHKLGGWEWC